MNAFGLPGGGTGTFKPFLKYNAKSGRFGRADRVQDASGDWVKKEIDLGDKIVFAADLANTRTGWMNFETGQAPRKVLVPFGQPIPPRPTDLDANGKPAFKAGFEFDVIINGETVVRELSANAATAVDGFGEVFGAYLASKDANPGKVPVLQVTETVGIKSKHGTNYQPKVQIVGWIDRPAIFDAQPEPVSAPTQVAAPAFVAPVAQVPAAAASGSGFTFG